MATLFQALGAIVYQGFTTTERDALNAQDRMTLWNTTTDQWEMYLSGDWRAVLILTAGGTITAAQHGTQYSNLHPEYAKLHAPGVITTSWMLWSGGSLKAVPGDPPKGEIVIQVKTSAGAPTHSASQGTLCWVSPDDDVYINNTGSTSWTKQAKNSDLHAASHDYDTHSGGVPYAEVEYDDATSDPLVDGAAADDGTEDSAARKDHVHPRSTHGVTHNAAHGISKHTEHANWKLMYSDGSGDQQEIAVGADGTVLTGTSTTGAPAFQAASEHAHGNDHAEDHKTRHTGGADALYSPHQYYFVPDAAPGDAITTGDQQGLFAHSGPSEETVKLITSHCKTAPVTSAATWQIEYGDTNDLDTVSSWTEIDLFSHTAAHKTIRSTSFTTATIPADRVIRFNVDGIGGTAAKDVNVIMEVWRELQS